MNRNTAVTTWREVCGSDTVMAMMPPTGRMLEDFARRIEAAERERCATLCRSLALSAEVQAGEEAANWLRDAADHIAGLRA